MIHILPTHTHTHGYVTDSSFSWISDRHVWVYSWQVLIYRPEQLSSQRLLYFPCVSLWLMATEMLSFVSLIVRLWDVSISFDFSTQWLINSILASAVSCRTEKHWGRAGYCVTDTWSGKTHKDTHNQQQCKKGFFSAASILNIHTVRNKLLIPVLLPRKSQLE